MWMSFCECSRVTLAAWHAKASRKETVSILGHPRQTNEVWSECPDIGLSGMPGFVRSPRGRNGHVGQL